MRDKRTLDSIKTLLESDTKASHSGREHDKMRDEGDKKRKKEKKHKHHKKKKHRSHSQSPSSPSSDNDKE